MKILVTVKQVPDTSGKVAVNPDGTLDRASMQTIINPDDLNAVEAALALKDELGCKVVAFTMGPPPAEGMLRELMAMGIAPERIYAEEKSFDTRENLLFAADIIRENGLDTHVVIASDNFHQYRGQLFARQAGLEAQSAGCFSPWFLGAGYACREVVGILATWAGIA